MEDQPGKSEVWLTADTAGSVLREQFPEVCDGRIHYLCEGWDSVAYLVSGQWVFRFPKRREVDARLQREVRLLDALVGQLPLPVPQVRWRGQPSPAFPFHFMGYRLLPGSQATEARLPACAHAGAAGDLGRFLTALHGVAVPQVVKLGFGASAEEDHAAVLLNEARHLADRIAPHLPPELREAARSILDGRVTPPPPYAGPWRLIHRDLQAEHILLSPTGAIAGVIDFGDATVGDPAVDFVGFYAWQGPPFREMFWVVMANQPMSCSGNA
jgi:aminoglycoside phosphotransferase (APT) family kinase protein